MHVFTNAAYLFWRLNNGLSEKGESLSKEHFVFGGIRPRIKIRGKSGEWYLRDITFLFAADVDFHSENYAI